jgi:formamidopyrimidine-DNA glycosylase
LDATALHQQIDDIEVHSERIVAENPGDHLAQALRHRRFERTRRHGKYLFAGLDSGEWLVLHFGMTGNLQYFKDMAQEPEYDQFLIHFGNGYQLAYNAPRKLGEIALADSVAAFRQEKDLGPDALDPDLDPEAFRQMLEGRRGMIKSALMNQQILAGIGNVYSDETLFQVGIHPRTRVKSLSGERMLKIYETMHSVLETAIDRRARPEQFPDSYLVPHRTPDGNCPLCGEPLKRVKVSGRSAYYCPNRQGDEPTGA